MEQNKATAALFLSVKEPFGIHQLDWDGRLGTGEVLCRIHLATICRSDVNTWLGLREEPCPSILGHEAYGEIIAWGGDSPPLDFRGHALDRGSLITWGINSYCGDCIYCRNDLEQKCVHRVKYGHVEHCVGEAPAGCFSESIVLRAGTPLFVLPEKPPKSVVLANCAVATAVHAVRALEPIAGGRVAVFGCGVLGLAIIRLLVRAGVEVIAVDFSEHRLKTAEKFGATALGYDLDKTDQESQIKALKEFAYSREGLDGAIEACGSIHAIDNALQSLRMGGRLVIAGSSKPVGQLPGDASVILKRCLTIAGIHNYRPADLAQAVDLLLTPGECDLFSALVEPSFALRDFNAAIQAALSKETLRVAVRPND